MQADRCTIVFCADEGVTEPISRWVDPLLGAWPRGEVRPRIVASSLAFQLDERDRTPGGETDPPMIVAVLADGADPALIARLGAQARRTRRPVIALVEGPDLAHACLIAEGVLVRPWSVGPEPLAEAVRTLWARQPVIRRLARLCDAHREQPDTLPSRRDEGGDARLAAAAQRALLRGPGGSVHGIETACPPAPPSGVTPWVSSVAQLDTNLVRFYLAEAEGADAETALLTLLIARTLDHQSPDANPMTVFEPARSLATLNAAIAGRTARAVSAVYAVLDTELGELTIAGAGVAPPTVFRGDTSERIDLGATPMGAEHHRDFVERVVPVKRGDVVTVAGRSLLHAADALGDALARAMETGDLADALGVIASRTGDQCPPVLLVRSGGWHLRARAA